MPGLDRYQNPQVYDHLASAYVLGVLRTPARKRFEVLMDERVYLREAVETWERRLGPLGEAVEPVQPPKRLWRRIAHELDQVTACERRRRSLWERLFPGPLVALMAGLAMVSVAVTMVMNWPGAEMPMPAYVSVLEGEQGKPMFVATVSRRPMGMMLKRVSDMPLDPDQDLELWCLMKGSGKPWPMGVLDRGKETVFHFTQRDWEMIEKTAGLAITVEPRGGARGDQPAGPMVSKGTVVPTI